ncbi:hypothetical protein EPO34_04360 [Patescibacteria group bacterium]|nr:MAG: hypothetical protein EPO34_04360 [Patescibacteria group bacterium]
MSIDSAPRPDLRDAPDRRRDAPAPSLDAAAHAKNIREALKDYEEDKKPSLIMGAEDKAYRLAESVEKKAADAFYATPVAALGAVEKGMGGLDKSLHSLEKWGEKHMKAIGEVPFIGGFLLWGAEKIGLIGDGGTGHEKKEDHGHAKTGDHGKKGGGGHH